MMLTMNATARMVAAAFRTCLSTGLSQSRSRSTGLVRSAIAELKKEAQTSARCSDHTRCPALGCQGSDGYNVDGKSIDLPVCRVGDPIIGPDSGVEPSIARKDRASLLFQTIVTPTLRIGFLRPRGGGRKPKVAGCRCGAMRLSRPGSRGTAGTERSSNVTA
jgi:hypothetical protein